MLFVKRVEKKRKIIRSIALITFLVGVAWQMIHWKGFFFQVSFLQVKSLTVGLGAQDLKDYGAICNTLQYWGCSENIFGQWIRRFPGSQVGLANFGIALGQMGKWQRSVNSFERYFKRGGNSFDAMLWYAKGLNQLLQPALALQWYYRSLSVSPGNSEVATALVDHLVGMGRFEEALSVIASFNRGVPEKNPFWQTKIVTIKKYIAQSGSEEGQDLKTKLRLPAIVGKSHFIPVKAGTESGYQFFLIDQRQEEITMTEDVLAKLIHSGSARSSITLGEAIQKRRVLLQEIQLGPWALSNIEVTLCKKCQPRIGSSILEYVNMEIRLEDATEFLLLSQR